MSGHAVHFVQVARQGRRPWSWPATLEHTDGADEGELLREVAALALQKIPGLGDGQPVRAAMLPDSLAWGALFVGSRKLGEFHLERQA